jgi:3-oxoacyl-[acyl-carrier-protein] synthase II
VSSTNRTVVVTGIGATTPLGGDSASTWEGLLAGRSGVKPLDSERFADLPVRIAAPAAVDPGEVLPRPLARKLDRSAQFALIAAREAWADAGYTAPAGEDEKILPERLGTVIASGIGGVTTLLDQYDVLKEKGVRRVSPHTVPMLMPNGPSANVGLEVNAQAGVHTPVSACASGAEAIGYAVEMIRTGRADVVVAGGTEAAIHPLPVAAFANMMAMSKNNDEPEKASRPYDKARDGFVLGEGAGIVVVEELEHARARGATILAELVGYGLTGDAYHITGQPEDHEGLGRAMKAALREAGAAPEEVDYINAHGTSTPLNDSNESRAIRKLLGAHADRVVVTSTKSATGHLLGAAGGIEAVFTAMACRLGIIPPTINFHERDPECDLDYATDGKREKSVRLALSNSSGFGGHNASLAIRRWEES